MTFIESAFQPDTASDWWNFAVNVPIAIGTVGAVVVALKSARRAEHDAEAANLRAESADERAERAQERLAALEYANLLIATSGLQREKNALHGDRESESDELRVVQRYKDTARVNALTTSMANIDLRLNEIDEIFSQLALARAAIK
jgi:hypothetical protein